MSKLRIEQWKSEPTDLTVMRAFAKAVPMMDRHAAKAALGWMQALAADPKTQFRDDLAVTVKEQADADR